MQVTKHNEEVKTAKGNEEVDAVLFSQTAKNTESVNGGEEEPAVPYERLEC